MTEMREAAAETLKKTFIALKRSQARVEALEARRREPIAIVGLACRLPGGVESREGLWDLLCREVDTSRCVPEDRWPEETFYSRSADAPGRTHAARAHFLNGPVDGFDAPFFGISAKEATAMDPQQRLLLEIAWQALEDAGIDPAALRGSPTGVFVGISSDDYAQAHRHSGKLELIDGYSLTGTCLAPAAGRISYTFGFEGPSMAIDTACSSSLVAVHLACQSLRDGETDVALAAGVNLILSPVFHIASSKLGTISPDGLCKTFDSSADGYGRGEGCAAVVLKRLSDAREDGDRILALIRGSAVNQDGRSNGLTAPNGLAQERVIREALDRAGLTPDEIGYIEVHGTGTPLGDPIEVEAIGRIHSSRPPERPVVLGTVKSNIGHLEAAAGIAGLVRAVEVLGRGEIPAHLHLDAPNPHIPWGAYPFEVLTKRRPWHGDGPRRAGVSSFGFSGTNAHVILEQAPDLARPEPEPAELLLLPLSARTEEALMELAGRWREWLAAPDAPLADAVATAAAGRSHMTHRLAVTGRSGEELAAGLDAYLQGSPARNLWSGSGSPRPKIAALFTGQGAQYPGMGRELYETEKVFRETIDACDAAIGDRLGKRLVDLLYGFDSSDSELQQTGFAQPALFAVEVALYRLWESWGVVPDLVCGHSIGEFAAAHVAGILGFGDAIDLVCARGALMQGLPAGGTMAAVFASEEAVEPLLEPRDGVSIAAVNTPNDVVISGPEAGVAATAERLAAAGIAVQALRVSHAFHSELMRPILDEFAGIARRPMGDSAIPFFSTVSAAAAAPGSVDSAYWSAQIRAPVRFAAAAAALAAEGAGIFLEYGPAPVLAGLARQSAGGEGRQFLSSLHRGGDGRRAMFDSLARLYVSGVDPYWKAVTRGGGRAAIPSYPFQRRRYYRAPIVDAGRRSLPAEAAGADHPYLGQRISSRLLPAGAVLHQALFTAEAPDFLQEHQIFDKIISPAAAHLAMAFAAAGEASALEDVSFTAPLVVEPAAARIVQLALEPGAAAYALESRAAGEARERWVTHSAGRIAGTASKPPALDLAAIRTRCAGATAPRDFYALIETLGYKTGPHFQCIREIAKGAGEALCRIEALERVDRRAIHPGLIDSVLQTVLPACEAEAAHLLDGESVLIPLHIARIALHGSLDQPLYCHSRVEVSGELVKAQLAVTDAAGAAVLGIDDFLLKRTDRATLYHELRDDEAPPVFALGWEPAALSEPEVAPDGWVLIGDGGGWGRAVAERLAEAPVPSLSLAAAGLDSETFARTVADWCREQRAERINLLLAVGGTGADPEAETRAALAALLPAVQALGRGAIGLSARLWLLTLQAQDVVPEDRGPRAQGLDGAALWGFGRAIANEMPEIWGGIIDVDRRPTPAGAAAVVAAALSSGENQLAIRRGGQPFAARLVPAPAAAALPDLSEGERYMLDRGPLRTLDDLRFTRLPRRSPGAGEVEIEVLAAGLNFRDVLNALGQYPGEAGLLGFEAVGRVAALGAGVEDLGVGDPVVALAAPGCIASHVTVDRALVVRKPAGMSAADAVALPAALLTAWYALQHLGRIARGERVLIHAAAGGVGLAAVQLSLAAGAEVFATAGSPEKQQFLRDMGVRHVMSSRTLDFADAVRAETGGKGVDLVLNSLSGDFIDASFEVLAPGGRFLEMGKIGIWDEARALARDPACLYRPFDLAAVALEDPAMLTSMFETLLGEIGAGRLAPLPITTFPMAEAEEAFRFMAQARHIGKIVLSREDEARRMRQAAAGTVRPDAHYLVTGGLGALGLRVARWLVDEGARHLVLAGRSAPGEAARAAIAEMEAAGARVTLVRGDVASKADSERMVEACASPPLAGIVHAAGLLEDGMIADLDLDRLSRVLAPKVAGGWNLHRAVGDRELDFFLLFSSIAAIIGNLGQGAYAAANAFMDGLASYRRRHGLAATGINWGPWAEAGMAAALEGDRFAGLGIRPLVPAQALRSMARLVAEAPVQAVVADVDWAAFGRTSGGAGGSSIVSGLAEDAGAEDGPASGEGPARDILAELAAALASQREGLMRAYLQDLARETLGYGRGETIMPDKPLADQGFDSLMSVDMRNRLNRALGRTLPASLLFDYPTVDRIARHLIELAVPASEPPGAAGAAGTADILDEIESLLSPVPEDAAAE